jgi:ribosomal protein S18 acetylase RimI-like enzyme
MVKHCPVSIVPNWIDPRSLVMDHDRSLRYRASLGIPPDAFVCAFAGNIGTAAGVEQVIEAFDHLFERQDLWLIIAGQGSRLAACQALAARTKSLHIHFHTPYPREQEALLLGAADLLLLPTRGEQTKVSVPSKLLTYMLAGQPVGAMAVSQSELADIVREAQCGWVVDPDRPELVAQSIRNFAGLPSDERREIGERGRRYLLRNFTKKRLLPKAIRIIEAATRKGPLCTVPFVEGDCGLRPMCEKDLPAVVRVHLGSFTDFFLSSLGPVFLRELYAGTITDPSGIAIVADVKHAIGGFVTGTTAPAGFFKRLLRERWWRFAIACIMPTIRRPWIVLRLMRALNMHTKSRGGLARGVLLSLAVSPEAQGKGIGRALVKAFLKEAALRGVQRVELTTDATGNTPVNRFYRDLGFNHKRRFTTPEGRQMNAYTIDIKI